MTSETRSRCTVCTVALAALLLAVVAPGLASAKEAAKDAPKADCPAVVKDAVSKAYPGSTVKKCHAEHEDGRDQFEVLLDKKGGGTLELDVSTDGKILQTEEKIDVAAVPDVVMKAFAAKYPKAKPIKAEKQTSADGKLRYELAWTGDKGKKEATFDDKGTFVEEE